MSARPQKSPTLERGVALLRGVNVGGANRLAMSDLRSVFADAGCMEAATILQSGNVAFTAPPMIVKGLAAAVEAEIARRLGLAAPVILRSAAALRTIVEANPFLRGKNADPALLHVMCLASRPSAESVAALDPSRSPPDEFVVSGQDIYLRLPNGVARSKLTNAYFDKALRTTGTARNWRTIMRLYEACAA